MSNKELEDDDTSDEDYNPEGENCGQVSEEESDGEPENNNSDDEVNDKQKKRKSKTKSKRSKKTKIEEPEPAEEKPQNTELSEEEQKIRTDSLWADFLKDTDFKPKPKAQTETKPITQTTSKPTIENKPKKILEFAGEIVNIPEKSTDSSNVNQGSSQVTSTAPTINIPAKRGRGGISSVLNQLGKKQKISTLEKSKLDWDSFKQQQNITEELKSYNKGKNG